MMKDDLDRILLTEEEIQNRVREMGREISRDYAGKNPLFVGVLKGCFVFMADLMRSVEVPASVDFMVVSSLRVDFLVACGPYVCFFCCRRFVLRHDARERVRHIGLFEIKDLLRREREIHGLRGTLDVVKLRRSDHRGGHLCEQPGERDLGHGYAVLFRELRHAGDDHIVL